MVEINRYNEDSLLRKKAWQLTEILIYSLLFLVFLIFMNKINAFFVVSSNSFLMGLLKIAGIVLLLMFIGFLILTLIGGYIVNYLCNKKKILGLFLTKQEKQTLENVKKENK